MPSFDPRTLTLSYERDLSKTDIAMQEQCSRDLISWTGLADELVSTRGQIETRSARPALLEAGRSYLRLSVTAL